jgi:hypothetical protein
MPPKTRDSWQRALEEQSRLWLLAISPVGKMLLGQLTHEHDSSWIRMEADKLRQAEPTFVTAELCDVIETAARSYQTEGLHQSDVFSSFGFVYFERSVTYDPGDEEDPGFVRAASWALLRAKPTGDPDPDDDLALADGDLIWHITFYIDSQDRSDPVIPQMYPTLLGVVREGQYDTITSPGGKAVCRILEVTLRLMQQRITAPEHVRPDKAARRMIDRAKLEHRDILVARLRRVSTSHTDGESTLANYSHRFIVGGHWRNQWFPAAQRHRQIWISPYVKGDESLPLVVKKRAFVLTR